VYGVTTHVSNAVRCTCNVKPHPTYYLYIQPSMSCKQAARYQALTTGTHNRSYNRQRYSHIHIITVHVYQHTITYVLCIVYYVLLYYVLINYATLGVPALAANARGRGPQECRKPSLVNALPGADAAERRSAKTNHCLQQSSPARIP
jgi:hypothetical protein